MSFLKQLFNKPDTIASQTVTNPTSSGIAVSLPELIQFRLYAANLTLNTRRQVVTAQTGTYHSRLRGRGMDFAEFRNYQPGDDIRHIDWRVTARTNRTHTKVFQEERERPVFILVDYNSSMFFGTRVAFKSVTAAKAAALIAWAAIAQGESIGGFIFSQEQCTELPPRSSQRGVLPFLKALAEQQSAPHYLSEPDKPTNSLALALMRLRRVARPGSLIFILSDFYQLSEEAIQHLSQLAQHHEVVTGFIYDQLEQQPPPPYHYAVSDGKQITTIDTTLVSFCNAYKNYFNQHQQYLQSVFNKYRIAHFTLGTHQPIVATLQKYFAK